MPDTAAVITATVATLAASRRISGCRARCSDTASPCNPCGAARAASNPHNTESPQVRPEIAPVIFASRFGCSGLVRGLTPTLSGSLGTTAVEFGVVLSTDVMLELFDFELLVGYDLLYEITD